jgi:hypothetical protein
MAAEFVTRVVLDPASIEASLASPHGAVYHDLAIRAQRVRDQAVVNASGRPGPNVITGRLRSSIQWRIVSDGHGIYAEIGSDVEYAGFVENGTGPYDILPRNKQALYWPDADHPVRIVHRQGNKAYPFLKPALQAAFGTSHR